MTEITPGEIKLIYLQLVLMAIVGIFVFLYQGQPVQQDINVNSHFGNQSQNDVSSSNANWITGLTPSDAGLGGILPNGSAELFIILSLVFVPLTIMNTLTAIRFVADMVKGIL